MKMLGDSLIGENHMKSLFAFLLGAATATLYFASKSKPSTSMLVAQEEEVDPRFFKAPATEVQKYLH